LILAASKRIRFLRGLCGISPRPLRFKILGASDKVKPIAAKAAKKCRKGR